MDTPLRNCPFCSQPPFPNQDATPLTGGAWKVFCHKCAGSGPLALSQEKARHDWNSRSLRALDLTGAN